MSLDPKQPVIICSSAVSPEGIQPTFTLGYSCMACGLPVQISPDSLAKAKEGSNVVCNRCGLQLLTFMKEEMLKNSNLRPTIVFQPETVSQIERLEGKPFLEVFPTAITRFTDEDLDPKPKT